MPLPAPDDRACSSCSSEWPIPQEAATDFTNAASAADLAGPRSATARDGVRGRRGRLDAREDRRVDPNTQRFVTVVFHSDETLGRPARSPESTPCRGQRSCSPTTMVVNALRTESAPDLSPVYILDTAALAKLLSEHCGADWPTRVDRLITMMERRESPKPASG